MATKDQIDTAADKIVKGLKAAAERSGLPGFVVAFENNGLLTTHFENMPMQVASRAIISLFTQLCEIEENNRASSNEYRATMGELKQDFLQLIAEYNRRFDALRGAPSGAGAGAGAGARTRTR